jgi:hypothetical protein
MTEDPRKVVEIQARDEGLWFEANTAPEAYLQAALRRLHRAVEGRVLEGEAPNAGTVRLAESQSAPVKS